MRHSVFDDEAIFCLYYVKIYETTHWFRYYISYYIWDFRRSDLSGPADTKTFTFIIKCTNFYSSLSLCWSGIMNKKVITQRHPVVMYLVRGKNPRVDSREAPRLCAAACWDRGLSFFHFGIIIARIVHVIVLGIMNFNDESFFLSGRTVLFFHEKAHSKVLSIHCQVSFVSHHSKNQDLKVMTSILIHRWRVNMNVLFVFWGCENPCKRVAATDAVEAALYVL